MNVDLIVGCTIIAINVVLCLAVLWYMYHWTYNIYNLLEEIRDGLRSRPDKEDPKRTWPPQVEAHRWRRR